MAERILVEQFAGETLVITKAMVKEPMHRYHQPTIFAQSYHQILGPERISSPFFTKTTVNTDSTFIM